MKPGTPKTRSLEVTKYLERVANKMNADLKKKYGPQISTEFTVVPELLGGMKTRVGSDVWDGSVKNRLERLSEKFN